MKAATISRTSAQQTATGAFATAVPAGIPDEALSRSSARVRIVDFLSLAKPRITFLVLVTTLVGFYLAVDGHVHPFLIWHTLLGTALVAGGASALNMVMEWRADARMRRTESRPIPAGRVTVSQGLVFGLVISAAGVLYLCAMVNLLTGTLALVTTVLYLFAYTPLKKLTSLCTVVGAIPGAIPPMMGWAAVRNSLDFPAWWLFAILFVWQLPHFLAIAWLYRDDYARGGFPMLPVLDPEGVRTGIQIIIQTVALLFLSVSPVFLGMFSFAYYLIAPLLGLIFLGMGVRLAVTKSKTSARHLLLTSVVYLPALLALMMFTKQ